MIVMKTSLTINYYYNNDMATKQVINNVLQTKNILNVAPILHTIDAFNFPGVTNESNTLVQQLIDENQKKHHIFFNDKGFHKYVHHSHK